MVPGQESGALAGTAGLAIPRQSASATSVDILGVRVSALSLSQTADRILEWATGSTVGESPRYVCATSVHGLVEAAKDASFRKILNRASIVTADGMPLVWWGGWAGSWGMERVYGPDLLLEVARQSVGRRVRHFFYGGTVGVAEELSRRLCARFPGLEVAGTHCPPFRPLTRAEEDTVVGRINESRADIVWVGLSTPKQERWIAALRERLGVKVLISVGAAFDFHSGRVPQAPRWMQRSGLEWLFRLSRDPGRLWRRYALNSPLFVGLALLQLSGLRSASERQDSARGEG